MEIAALIVQKHTQTLQLPTTKTTLSAQVGLRWEPHTTLMRRPTNPVFASSFMMFHSMAVKRNDLYDTNTRLFCFP